MASDYRFARCKEYSLNWCRYFDQLTGALLVQLRQDFGSKACGGAQQEQEKKKKRYNDRCTGKQLAAGK